MSELIIQRVRHRLWLKGGFWLPGAAQGVIARLQG
jgi:hypothetical protein